ncbi:hypothetical protein DW1_0966 [Proteiniborus sp. DW1]|nr:hypothetical protein DW1_0966 [Proteiniborus sp. DW1]
MKFQKLYTVDDIAMMTGLTSRTIRNYLKDGKLKGKKIGAQWRFTEEDISALFTDKSFENEVTVSKNKMVIDFLEAKEQSKVSICSIVDYPCRDRKVVENICQEMIEQVNSYKNKDEIKFSYQYLKEEGKARFIVIGIPEKVIELLNKIK